MNKNQSKKKLTVRGESLRILQGADLAEVIGGARPATGASCENTGCCPSNVPNRTC